ncbi:hypothetical protein L1049_009081 [Liquidambar formosana]|uniref:Uncharacterized protein n=1 Tax=Liquidambar formosana TaxID=63359 RepID=A0AAP0X654_LIQFO
MERKPTITKYRERLDKTLASHDLTNEETLKTLVKNQLLSSSQYETEEDINSVLERRTVEVSNFIDMLRSASVNDNEASKTRETPHAEWKLKQDTEDCRVMYREGPKGTPFHTLLVEGYVDAPIDVCLCVSWESNLYKKWWPQFTVPAFKVISSQCLQKVRIGENISSVRMKLSWPLSAREALVHFFEFEYFQDDLIIVLANTISDLESVDKSTHGFTNDGLPEAKDIVRIDFIGGFALQKVTPDRSYFRTIANMDIKLDFVPPALINFIARQLVGNGFRLYQKAVGSVSKSDEDFIKALGDPMYARIRETLYSNNKANEALEPEDRKSDICILPEEHEIKTMPTDIRDMDPIVLGNENAIESSPQNAPLIDQNTLGEIEEEEIEESRHLEEGRKGIDHSPTDQIADKCRENDKYKSCLSPEVEQAQGTLENATESSLENVPVIYHNALGEIEEEEIEESRHLEEGSKVIDHSLTRHSPTNQIAEKFLVNNKYNFCLSPGVEQALGTLEQAISMIREFGFNAQTRSPSGFVNEEFHNLETDAEKNSTSSEDGGSCSDGVVGMEASKEDIMERTSDEHRNSSGMNDSRHMGSYSYSREVNHNRIAPALAEQNLPTPSETHQVALCSSPREVNHNRIAPALSERNLPDPK